MPDSATISRFEALLCAYLDGDLAQADSAEFVALLKAHPEFTDQLREQLAIDAQLGLFESGKHDGRDFHARLIATLSAQQDAGAFVGQVLKRARGERSEHGTRPAPVAGESRRTLLAMAAVLVAGLFVGLAWWARDSARAGDTVARIGSLADCRWTNPATHFATGDPVVEGQRIELSSGSAELVFTTGARLTLVGPAIFEARSATGGFLTMGRADLVAETPESRGFTVQTPTSKFIDISTAFTAQVSPDGLSHLNVAEGEVDVVLDGTEPLRFRTGESLYVEPGERKILSRIEPGDATAAFRFPTIAPPSADDFADQKTGSASIRLVDTLSNPLAKRSGTADRLLDGSGQSASDAPGESLFFAPGGKGVFILDLGREVAVARINTYSWHQHEEIGDHRTRARQSYTVYGSSGDLPPPAAGIEPTPADNWTRIARVNSDRFFEVDEQLDRPAQQACSITAENGDIGRYRYLLWVVDAGTFYGEIDVFAVP